MSQEITILTVADQHRDKALFEQLAEAIKKHQPDILALVGDFLNAFRTLGEIRFDTREAAQFLSRLKVPETIFIRGNHEDSVLRNHTIRSYRFSKRTSQSQPGQVISP